MFPIKRTVFFTNVTVHKNRVRLIGNIEYVLVILSLYSKLPNLKLKRLSYHDQVMITQKVDYDVQYQLNFQTQRKN